MMKMKTLTKAWTYGVAYLSLTVGSGVSVAGNIADTYRVAEGSHRGVDVLDIVISAFWPAAVLLAIEMFVSALWPKTLPMQIVRWAGSLGIGFVAMYVSWHHLADLLGSRGQDSIVATIGPLAIDGLAIMATGLILSSRGQAAAVANLAKPATLLDKLHERQQHTVDNWNNDLASASQPMDPAWTAEDEAMLASFERDMDRLELAKPISVPPALARSNEIKPESVPAEAAELVRAWLATSAKIRPLGKDRDVLLAAHFGVSPRAARRWYEALAKVAN